MKSPLPFDRRLARFEFRPHVGNPREIINLMSSSGVEVLVASGMHQDGWAAYPSKVAVAHPEMDPDFIPELIRLAHKKDIMVLSWYNMRQNVPLAKLHPEWQVMMKLPDGRIVPEETNFCLFSSPYQDFVLSYSAEILELGFDGLWYDGAWPGSREHPSCYCHWCSQKFRYHSGHEIPQKVDWDDPVFREWVRWRYRLFDEFVTRLYQNLTTRWPPAIIMMNHYNRPSVNSPSPEEGTSWKNGVSLDVMKFPGGGGNENSAVMNRLHTTGFNARIVKAQCPQRFDVWEPGGTLWRSVVYPELENDRTHSLLHGFWTLSLGGVPWTALINVLTRQGKPDGRVMKEWKRRRPYFGGEPVTYCAVHYSQMTRDFYGRNHPNVYYSEVYGLYDVCVEGHFLTDLILDTQLTDLDYLKRYRVLVLPNSACLSESQGETIRRFVHSGGVVIASFETGLYDQEGQRRKDFLLSDVFGVSYLGSVNLTPGPWGKTIYDRDNIPHQRPLIRVEDAHLEKKVSPVVFFGANYTRVKVAADSKVIASTVFASRVFDLYPQKEIRKIPADSPAIVWHRYGKGEAIYLTPEAGRGFLQWPHPELRKLLEILVGRGKPWITLQAPKIVEMTAFLHPKGVLAIHLVNLPWSSNRPPVPYGIPVLDEVFPVHDIEVRIRNVKSRNVSLPLSREKVRTKKKGSDLLVTVPVLKYHQVIWIRMGAK